MQLSTCYWHKGYVVTAPHSPQQRQASFVVNIHLSTPSTMDRDGSMLPSTASVAEQQNEQTSTTNGTRHCQPIPWRNFGLCTLYAPYKATQHTSSQHNEKTNRLNGALTIPSLTNAQNGQSTTHTKLRASRHRTHNAEHWCNPTGDSLGQHNVSQKTPRVLQGYSLIQAPDWLYLHNTLSQHQSTPHCRWIPKQSVPTPLHSGKMDNQAENPSRSTQGGQKLSGSTCLWHHETTMGSHLFRMGPAFLQVENLSLCSSRRFPPSSTNWRPTNPRTRGEWRQATDSQSYCSRGSIKQQRGWYQPLRHSFWCLRHQRRYTGYWPLQHFLVQGPDTGNSTFLSRVRVPLLIHRTLVRKTLE